MLTLIFVGYYVYLIDFITTKLVDSYNKFTIPQFTCLSSLYFERSIETLSFI
jgi:hypothetical protein